MAAGLQGVAVEVLLLVPPDLLAGHQEDQEPEDEDDGQPDAAEAGGVLVDPAEEALQEGLVHGSASDLKRKPPPQKKSSEAPTAPPRASAQVAGAESEALYRSSLTVASEGREE